MDELYRMLGREREADLEREAERLHRGAGLRSAPNRPVKPGPQRTPGGIVGFVARLARGSS
jgi:hypothetical protein